MKIYFECKGWGPYNKERTKKNFDIQVYVKPKNGKGHQYDSKGNLQFFYWANPRESLSFNEEELPEEMLYSIKHGSCDMHLWIDSDKLKDIDEDKILLIYKKNKAEFFSSVEYDRISKEDVENYNKVLEQVKEINDIEQFKSFYLSNKYVQENLISEVMYKLLSLVNAKKSPIINGEIGFAYLNDMYLYLGILETFGLPVLINWK